MPKALTITESALAANPRAAASIATWQADLRAEGWSVLEPVAVPATITPQALAALVAARTPDHVQVFGGVQMPQVVATPDGHGPRPGGNFCVLATPSLDGWQWDGAVFNASTWPADAVRTVSSANFAGLPELGSEVDLFCAWMARVHAYRTGARTYDGVAVLSNHLEYLQAGLNAELTRQLAVIVGAGNVLDTTGKYPFEQFFQTYSGRSFLVGALYDGAHPAAVGEYNTGLEADFASGLVQIAALMLFCSSGWIVNKWPLQRAALAGGSLVTIYNPWASASIEAWNEQTPFGRVLMPQYRRGSWMIWMPQGDGTIRRRAQEMGVTQDSVNVQIASLFQPMQDEVASLRTQIQAMQATIANLGNNSAGGDVAIISAYYRGLGEVNPAKWRDVADRVKSLLAASSSFVVSNANMGGDPTPGWPKELAVTFTRSGLPQPMTVVPEGKTATF